MITLRRVTVDDRQEIAALLGRVFEAMNFKENGGSYDPLSIERSVIMASLDKNALAVVAEEDNKILGVACVAKYLYTQNHKEWRAKEIVWNPDPAIKSKIKKARVASMLLRAMQRWVNKHKEIKSFLLGAPCGSNLDSLLQHRGFKHMETLYVRVCHG